MSLVGIIPAAGKATRMGTSGHSLPKALIEIEGQTLLDRAIESLKKINVDKIVVVVGHLGDQLVEFLESCDFGIEIGVAHQDKPLGLAHAIATASNQIDDDFVVLCPDNIYTDQNDLIRTKEIFASRRCAFILLATVTPDRQPERKSYSTSALRNLDANLYEYRNHSDRTDGLAINSTGCVFFRRDSLAFLPSFAGYEREYIFRNYLETIAKEQPGALYLLRGMRYDFSEPRDVEKYVELQRQLGKTSGEGVSAILINRRGQVLLQQRDENPSIRYPGHWSLFGGSTEYGESAAAAVAREVQEEIEFPMRNFGLFREFVQNNKREFAFVGELTAELSDLTLSEGQGMNFFYPTQIEGLLIRPDDRETLREYFGV